MSSHTSRKTTTTSFRTVNVASPEPLTTSVSTAASQVTTLPYALNGGGSYETVRYLVPVQQAMPQQQQHSYVFMQQPMMQQSMIQQPMIQQPMLQQAMMQQVVSPVYLQSMPRLSVSSLSSQNSDLLLQQRNMLESQSVSRKSSSVFSQSSSPIKSPELSLEEGDEEVEEEPEEDEVEEEEEEEEEVEVVETEIINVIQQKPPPVIQKVSRTELRTELREIPEPTKMDTRYFGELLADVYRKNCDIHSCISDHVSKMRGQKHQLDPSNDYKVEKEEVEALIPKGATELTKQQIRYLLQTRLTADKSMRLLLSSFSSLREELLHMAEDLRRLESEKESLERDLSFKADQAKQYDCLLEGVRENNRQLQLSLKETSASQRSLESQLSNSKNNDSSREFKVKELEGRLRALEKENEMLRQKLSGQASSTTLQIKTEELSRHYQDQLDAMRREKEQELQRLRTQITKMQTEITTTTTSSRSSSDHSLQLKISELLAMLEKRQLVINRQEEEIKRLMQARNEGSSGTTKTIITKRYTNQYPMLGLLGDEYKGSTSSVREAQTVIIEKTGEKTKLG